MNQSARIVLTLAAYVALVGGAARDASAAAPRVTGVRVSADRHTLYAINSSGARRAVARTCDARSTFVPLDSKTLAETLSPSGRWISADVFTKTDGPSGGVQTTWFVATADGALVRTSDFPRAFGARPVERGTTSLWNPRLPQTLSYGSKPRRGDISERATLDFPNEPRAYARARCVGKA